MLTLQSIASRAWSAFTFRGQNIAKPLTKEPNWWKNVAGVYQVWPASFKDSNGDGLGDIPGIISKLDYIKQLGVDVVWLSPHYASPQVDMGYDISNYEDVYPPYGTLDDMDNLIKGLHDRGIRIILDLVINHTSDQHAWFLESKKSRDNPKADWYIWKDPVIDEKGNRHPPNNWGSTFGGCAWDWVEEREQYYLHLFTVGQPDLNFESDAARKAIHDSALRFWFDKGVDGFRIDTCSLYSKVQSFPDGPVDEKFAPYGNFGKYCSNGPRIHEFFKEIRKEVLDNYGDPMMVGELPGSTVDQIMKYVGADRRELSMVFDFSVCFLGGAMTLPKHLIHGFKLPEMKRALRLTQDLTANTNAWSSVFMENHDNPRSISRYATDDPKYWERAAKVLAMLLGTLSGTLFIYQGQEIGMTNFPESWSPDDLRDVEAIRYWKDMLLRHPHDSELLKRAWSGIVATGRDNSRLPVQWSSARNAGFTTAEKPWIRVNDNYKDINVEKQLGNENSVLAFWRKMLALRKEYLDVLVYGAYEVFEIEDEKTFTFQKKAKNGRAVLVCLNFSKEEARCEVPPVLVGKRLELLVGNAVESEEMAQGSKEMMETKLDGKWMEGTVKKGTKVVLEAWEGRVYVVNEEDDEGYVIV